MKTLIKILVLVFGLENYSCATSQKAVAIKKTQNETSIVEPTSSKTTETIITFKKGFFPKCGDTLSVEGYVLSIINNETSCSYGNEGEDLWLYPATLHIKLNSSKQIKSIKIDYVDGCGNDCTVARLLNRSGEEIQKQMNGQTNIAAAFEFNTNLTSATTLTISSFEGKVQKITFVYLL